MVTITVDETGDAEFSETGTTLREAISIANATAGADRIEFDASVFTGGEASLIRISSTLIIDESVTIDASFAGGVTITGDSAGNDILRTGELTTDILATGSAGLEDNVRVIGISDEVTNELTTLIGLTITGGRTRGSNYGRRLEQDDGGFNTSLGGGIVVNEGDLIIINSNVIGNSTENGAGGGIAGNQLIELEGKGSDDFIRVFSSTVGYNISEGESGGGVFGTFVEVTNSTIVGNATLTSYAAGGGVFGGAGLIVSNATIINNHTEGFNSHGGGLTGPNDLYITNSTITGNWIEGAGAGGGGISAFDTTTLGIDGVVINDTKQIINTIIIGNESSPANNVSNNNAWINPDENNIVEGLNLINDLRMDFDILGEGGFAEASLTSVFANIVDGKVVLTDNLGPTLTAALRNDALNPAIDASGRIATDADATGRPAQDFLNVGASSLPGIRDLGAYEVPVLSGGLPMIEGTELADILNATTLEELFSLLTGADTVIGSAAELNGDRINGFGDDDKLIVQGASFGADDVSIVMGSAILNIDTTANGSADTVVTLEGDFSSASFQFLPTGNGTEITVDLDGGSTDPGPVDLAPTDPGSGANNGADIFIGTSAADTFNGLGGDDTLSGRGGADSLTGGRGNDNVSGGGGKDALQGNGGKDLLRGNGGRDTLEGGGGKDTLEGGGGRDLLQGGGGRDSLDGGGGKDEIIGGGGRDDIFGGRGSDDLTGGGGRDRFIFDRGNGRDTITDFQQNRDKIVVEGGADSFADLTITQVGNDVRILIGNTRVTVEDDLIENFTAADFIF